MHVSYYCRVFTCSNGKESWRFRVSRRQTSTSPITLERVHLLVNVVVYPLIINSTVNKSTSDSMTSVTAGAYNQNINKRQARKLIWTSEPYACYGSQILQ